MEMKILHSQRGDILWNPMRHLKAADSTAILQTWRVAYSDIKSPLSSDISQMF